MLSILKYFHAFTYWGPKVVFDVFTSFIKIFQ